MRVAALAMRARARAPNHRAHFPRPSSPSTQRDTHVSEHTQALESILSHATGPWRRGRKLCDARYNKECVGVAALDADRKPLFHALDTGAPGTQIGQSGRPTPIPTPNPTRNATQQIGES
eukprot:6492603-Pyramimonas_sp.AAC.1